MDYRNIKIGFIGSMNAMPMQYALRFKEDGFDVKYIVESPKNKMLMRPEKYFNSIDYPYPNWIKEIYFKRSLIRIFLNKYFSRKIYNEMKDRDVIIFNHYGHHFSINFNEKSVIKIALFSGADLYSSCSYKQIENFESKDNFLIKYLKKKLLKITIDRYREGIHSCHILSYFPKGMNKEGDRFIEEIMKDKPFFDIRRYDVNFKETGLKYVGAKKSKKLVLFSGVRFLIDTTEHNSFEYKGNDLIIKGIAKYYKVNKNIEVHFVEKGKSESLKIAKRLCKDLGIEDVVIWHKEMSLSNLFELYKQSDVLFDQVGRHWLGAVGMYAMYMGKPLIANARLDVFGEIWGKREVPILDASSVDDIYNYLVLCESYEYRKYIGELSHIFAKDFFDVDLVYKQYKSIILELYSKMKK